MKLYIEELKYSEENDNFDFKLIIFYNLYSRAAISLNVVSQAYLTMLRSLALDYYYTNLKNRPTAISFEQVYNATRNYFKGSKYKRSIL